MVCEKIRGECGWGVIYRLGGSMFMCLEVGIDSDSVYVCVCVCECLVYPDISLSVQSLMLTLLAASPLHY